METLWGILKQALAITGFVMTMMLIIEYVNVLSQGKVLTKLQKKPGLQIITGTILGLIPGCMGVYTAVSMYTHRLLSIGALTAAMIATSGDETFLMFALIPQKVWIIMAVLAIVAIVSGFLTDKFMGKRDLISEKGFTFDIHKLDHKECIKDNIKLFNFKFSLPRISALTVLAFFIVAPFIGFNGHAQHTMMPGIEKHSVEIEPVHQENSTDHHENNHHEHEGLNWVTLTLVISASIGFIICLTCSEHFLKDHIIKHILFKHLPKILIWTVIALIIINLFLMFTDFQLWINKNLWIVLIVAVLVGLIPESGPHLLFLTMFVSGTIPLSILIANSIVQDGHGALPLFAESKKSFFVIKLINLSIGFLIGAIGLLLNY
jgi:hypothetical protein